MAYKELKKIFYSAPSSYEDIYQQRFHSEYAHRIPLYIGDFPAFFITTPDIQQLLLDIIKGDKEVCEICGYLPNIAKDQFSLRCLIDEIVLTNNIEGVYSTRKEIGDTLSQLEQQDRRSRFHGLVQKYLLLRNSENLSVETCTDIRKIYDDLVVDEIAQNCPKNLPDGEIFRKDLAVVSSPSQKEIHRGLYPESKVIAAMEHALAYLNNEQEELLYRISVFHYLLGYIHPFYDGNGRLNRFISSYMLTKELHPLLSYRLSYTVKENISKYYAAFHECNDFRNRGDLTPFVEMFLNIIKSSVLQLIQALDKRRRQMDYYLAILPRLPHMDSKNLPELYNLLFQAELFSESGISTVQLMQYLRVSRTTLGKLLKIVRSEGFLKEEKIKRENYYGIDLKKVDQHLQSSAAEIPS